MSLYKPTQRCDFHIFGQQNPSLRPEGVCAIKHLDTGRIGRTRDVWMYGCRGNNDFAPFSRFASQNGTSACCCPSASHQLLKWEMLKVVVIYICCSRLDAIVSSGRGKSLYPFIRRGDDGTFIARWPASRCVSTAALGFLHESAPFLNACVSDSLSTSTAAGMESSWISPKQARCLNLGREEPDCNHSKGLNSNLSLIEVGRF